jgi:hypothetical protein
MEGRKMTSNKRMESDSLHRRFVSPLLAAHARRPSKLGDMLAQKKIDEARRLTPEQRLLIALQLSDAAAALHRAGCKKR